MKNNESSSIRKKIALLAGGLSAEKDVSLISSGCVIRYLRNMGHEVVEVDLSPNLAKRLIKIKPDIVFNCLHGTYGEDGAVQGLLEIIGIPYTHSGVKASAVAMNKTLTKYIAERNGIRTPSFVEMETDHYFDLQESGKELMPRPYVIKPVFQGSTIGVHIIKDDKSSLPKRREWKYGTRILIEEYIPGKEISSAVVFDKARGVLELQPRDGFYDYDSKYTEGLTTHVMPADIPQSVYQEAMGTAEKMHWLLGCRTISRSDFRYDPNRGNNGLYLLEINTHPGFTDLSILPEIAAHAGISFAEIIEGLLRDAKCELRDEFLTGE